MGYPEQRAPRSAERGVCTCRVKIITFILLVMGAAAPAFGQYVYVGEFGGPGTDPGQFADPSQVAMDSLGNVLVADEVNSRVQICSPAGACTVLGGASPPDLFYASGVAEDALGRIVVSDFFNHRIHICDRNASGECAIRFGTQGSGLGQFNQPRSVAVDSQGRILVADRVNGRIQICNDSGSCSGIGSAGSGVGQFEGPDGLAIDDQDRIIVADTLNNRIQVCTDQGSCTAFGTPGSEPGQFRWPAGVGVDHAGRIIVVDSQAHRLQICDYQGSCTVMGEQGPGPGQFYAPSSVVADGQGNIYVADRGDNDRIQIFNDPDFVPDNFGINAGMNDAWLNFGTAGQGVFLTVFPVLGKIFMAMFTFDTVRPPEDAEAIFGEPGHRWFTAFGDYAGNEAVLEAELTHGGIFNSPQPAPEQEPHYGTITLTFSDCNSLTLTYDFPTLGLSGTIEMTRLTLDNVALCEALQDN